MEDKEVKFHEEVQKMEYEPLVLFLISKFVMTTH